MSFVDFDRQRSTENPFEGFESRALMLDRLDEWLSTAPKHELKDLIKRCNDQLRGRYRENNRGPKYGNQYRWMSIEDLVRFFEAFRPEEFKWRTLFATQFYLALRIGEVVKLRLEDLDFQSLQVRIRTEKKGFNQFDSLHMAPPLRDLLMQYLRWNERQCTERGGWLFPAKEPFCATPHVSPLYLRKVFRQVCARAGLDKSYGERSSMNGHSVKGQLHLYTTHSLRHSCARLLKKTGIPREVIQAVLRHDDLRSTAIYVRAEKEDADAALKKVFG